MFLDDLITKTGGARCKGRVMVKKAEKADQREGGATQRDRLSALLAGILPISRKHKKLTLSHLAALLLIAVHEQLTAAELTDALGLEQSTVSRMTDLLSGYGKRGTKGLDLIQDRDDPQDRRRKIYSLSPKGRALLDQMLI
jgi:DNA-binding MarR family transcriptional regulator